MKFPTTLFAAALFAAALVQSPLAHAQRQMEALGRGVVAVPQGEGKIWISWRLLGTEPADLAFNLYRTAAGGAPVKLNAEPLAGPTHFVDANADLTQANAYSVRAVVAGLEQAPSAAFAVPAGAPARQYLPIPLKSIAGYSPNDVAVGDLDGDGEYELVVHMSGRGRDNSAGGPTDAPVYQAYKLDGTFLWEINLGKNIREGAHYTQLMVYDLDGDGRAEVVCKTADGTVDGLGKVLGDPKADWVAKEGQASHRDTTGSERGPDGKMITNPDGTHIFTFAGRILSGPEYLTVFEGATGKALATTNYTPPLGNPELWGDAYGNRSERYLACVAYLDGRRPSVVMCRGYYARTTLSAWDWRDGKLTQRWLFDSDDGTPGNEKYRGQGNHNLSVGDVDGDGKDEIVYGSCTIDDNGKGLYSTGMGHGDAMHLSDLDPDRPGLEVFSIHERPHHPNAASFFDARTGEVLWGKPSPDVGRGIAINIDPRHRGSECWSSASGELYNCKGEKIADRKPRSANFAVWWDGDLLREILDSNRITKWNWIEETETPLLTAEGCTSNNGTKSTPALSADLFGDWREEVIWRTEDGKELRIYTTTIPTPHRLFTLMHDPQYRLAIAWQNVAYNQPPHPSFYLDESAPLPPPPAITLVPAK